MAFDKTRLYHFWFLLTRPMTLGARALALNDRGEVLLIKHTYVDGWHLPGGGIEKGEDAQYAMRRELEEEANCVFDAEPRLLGFYYNNSVTRRDHVVVYVCENARQTAPKETDGEIIAAQFFAVDALPEGTTKGTARRIAEYVSGSAPGTHW